MSYAGFSLEYKQNANNFQFQVQGFKDECYLTEINSPWSDPQEIFTWHHFAYGVDGDIKFVYIDGIEVRSRINAKPAGT